MRTFFGDIGYVSRYLKAEISVILHYLMNLILGLR